MRQHRTHLVNSFSDRRGFERALFVYPFKAGDVESMLERLAGKG